MSDWPKYESHKVVQAAKIVSIHYDFVEGPNGSAGQHFLWVDPGTGVLEKFTPTKSQMLKGAEVGGWAIIYPDGFKSVSPRQAFEEGYLRVEA